jgi:hypothetical protein
MTQHNPTPSRPAAATCTCAHPLPRVLAERKGAARTTCERCGLPIRLRLHGRDAA